MLMAQVEGKNSYLRFPASDVKSSFEVVGSFHSFDNTSPNLVT